MIKEFAAAAYTVTCQEIGNCANQTTTLDLGLTNIAKLLVDVIGMLAIVFIIGSGLQMTLSAGDPKRYQQGKQSLQYAIIGLVVALLSYTVVAFVSGSL